MAEPNSIHFGANFEAVSLMAALNIWFNIRPTLPHWYANYCAGSLCHRFKTFPLNFAKSPSLSDNNFEWVGETNDGCLLCVWEEEVLLGGTAVTSEEDSSDNSNYVAGSYEACNPDSALLAPSLTTATHLAIASPDLLSVQVSTHLLCNFYLHAFLVMVLL